MRYVKGFGMGMVFVIAMAGLTCGFLGLVALLPQRLQMLAIFVVMGGLVGAGIVKSLDD